MSRQPYWNSETKKYVLTKKIVVLVYKSNCYKGILKILFAQWNYIRGFTQVLDCILLQLGNRKRKESPIRRRGKREASSMEKASILTGESLNCCYCLCAKTKKRWPYQILLILNSVPYDVTIAMLVQSNKETVAILDLINIEQFFARSHGRHIALVKQRNGGHIGSY